MSKLAFLASFLAAFITMDEQFFRGDTTRAVWRGVNYTAQAAQIQVQHWTRPIGRF